MQNSCLWLEFERRMKSFSIDESPYAFARVYMVKICLSQTRIGQGKDCVSFVDRVMCF